MIVSNALSEKTEKKPCIFVVATPWVGEPNS